jgi:small subunit ribosomal protein S16
MKRFGRKNRPYYRICVIDRRKAREGLPIEEVGTYDPMVYDKAKRVTLNLERIEYWISVGAQPSEHVATLIKKVKTNSFGQAKAAAPALKPKELAVAAAPAAEGEAAPAEEAPAAE